MAKFIIGIFFSARGIFVIHVSRSSVNVVIFVYLLEENNFFFKIGVSIVKKILLCLIRWLVGQASFGRRDCNHKWGKYSSHPDVDVVTCLDSGSQAFYTCELARLANPPEVYFLRGAEPTV